MKTIMGKKTIKYIGLMIMTLMLVVACGSDSEENVNGESGNMNTDTSADIEEGQEETNEDVSEEANEEPENDMNDMDDDNMQDNAEDEVNEEPLEASSDQSPTNYSFRMVSYIKEGDEPEETHITDVYVKDKGYYISTENADYFYHPEDENVALYSKADNTLLIMATDDEESAADLYTTPWQMTENIGFDANGDLYSEEFYEGEEDVNGVTMKKYVHDYEDMSYIFYYDPDKKIIGKIEYNIGDTMNSVEFQNYEEGTVTDEDIAYPEDAEVTDLTDLDIEQ